MATYFDVIFWAVLGGAISLTVGASILANKNVAKNVSRFSIPFAAGALLGATFFDLLPEAAEAGDIRQAFTWVVVAVIVFFVLERYLQRFHHHEQETVKLRKRATSPLIIIGDAVHNSLDGVVIGAAFLVSVPVGIVTTIAVSAHEIPRKAGDFGVLLRLGMRRLHVLMWNSVSALTTVTLALITFRLGSGETLALDAVLGFSAGLLIYVAMSDLIPTIHDEAKGRFAALSAILLIAGVIVVATAADVAHEYVEEGHGHDQGETSEAVSPEDHAHEEEHGHEEEPGHDERVDEDHSHEEEPDHHHE